MKASQSVKSWRTALLALVVFGLTSAQAHAESIDLLPAIKQFAPEVHNKCKELADGNSRSGSVTKAVFHWNQGDNRALVEMHCRVHNKNQNCVRRLTGGRWCVDTYNYWATIYVKAVVYPSCRVGEVAASSDSERYSVPAAFSSLLWSRYFSLGIDALGGNCPI